jgi:hypothetical protein
MEKKFYPTLSAGQESTLKNIANDLEVKTPVEFADFVAFKQVLKDAGEAAITAENVAQMRAISRYIIAFNSLFITVEEQRGKYEKEKDETAVALRKLLNEL